MSIPVTESDTIHAAQREIERLLESDDMRYLHVDTRQLLRLMATQSGHYADLHDQVQDLQKRLDRMKRSGAGEEDVD